MADKAESPDRKVLDVEYSFVAIVDGLPASQRASYGISASPTA